MQIKTIPIPYIDLLQTKPFQTIRNKAQSAILPYPYLETHAAGFPHRQYPRFIYKIQSNVCLVPCSLYYYNIKLHLFKQKCIYLTFYIQTHYIEKTNAYVYLNTKENTKGRRTIPQKNIQPPH